MSAYRFRPLLIAAAALLGPGLACAEDAPAAKPERNVSFVVMPIPVSNPSIGNGLAVAGLALYKADGSTRPWTTGVGGFYTDSKSWAGLVGQKAYLDHDRFRVTAGVGYGDVNTDYFGIGPIANARGRSIPINTRGGGALVEALMRVAPHLYAGLEYRLIDTKVTFDISQTPFGDLAIPNPQLDSTDSMLGLAAEYDTRDSEYYPTRGWYITGAVLRADTAIGGDFDYTRAELAANRYIPMGDKAVLALRGSFCSAGDDAPFYDLCAYGSQNDLRGYVSGEYLDHAMYAVQAEYRRHLFWRVGAAAFAGVGATGRNFRSMSTDDLLPAAGVGLRFQASKVYGVNARIDYAWGKNGSEAVYFSVGEAF